MIRKSFPQKFFICFLLITAVSLSFIFVCPYSSFDTVNADMSAAMPDLAVTASSYLMQSSSRGITIANKNEQQIQQLPALSQLLTCIFAIEALPEDTVVTISSEVQTLDDYREGEQLQLVKGEKLPASFLIAAVLYKNSRAATLSLAEYIAGSEETFSEQLNTFAEQTGLYNTFISPRFIYEDEGLSGTPVKSYSTLSDLMVLFRYGLGKPSFRDLFTTFSTPVITPEGYYHSLTNDMSPAWVLASSSSQVLGAVNFPPSDSATSTILALAGSESFESYIILHQVDNISIYRDLEKVNKSIYQYFETSDLVRADDPYQSLHLSITQEPVATTFKSTIRYLHPTNDPYLLGKTEFRQADNLSLPLFKGTTVGQVIFTLRDGSQITADVISAEDVQVKNTLRIQLQALLSANRNLSIIIFICFFCLVVVILQKILAKIIRFMKNSSTKTRHL